MQLRTVVGTVELWVWHGQEPQEKRWSIPIRESWGLVAHQRMSPALEEKLAFTATVAASYADAALLAKKWGSEVDDSVIHALVQRLGSKAEEQTQERLQQLPQESQPQRGPAELAVLMMDGWQVRFRGSGWGKKNTQKERVEWHELKTGVFYVHEQAARTEGGRGMIAQKIVVRWQGEPWNLDGGCTGKLVAGAWVERRRGWYWRTGARGFGIWRPIVGPEPESFWISIMGASTCGHLGGLVVG